MAFEREDSDRLTILCWNINSLAPTVRNAVLRDGSWHGFLERGVGPRPLDIACLQEAKLPEDRLTKELVVVEGFESYWAVSRVRRGYSGVTTYAAASRGWGALAAECDTLGGGEDEELDREGRCCITDHGAFVLINVYVPNAGDASAGRPRLAYKLRFLRALQRKADEYRSAGREVIIAGDLNIAASPQADMHPACTDSYNEEERSVLAALTSNYTDAWRHLHPCATGVYTVWDEKTSARAFNQGQRIDYFLLTPGLLERVVSCEVLCTDVLPPKWSDHAGLLLELHGVAPPSKHPPCTAWATLLKRFHDPSQRSILSMFSNAKKRPVPADAAGGTGSAAGVIKAAGAAAKARVGASDGAATEAGPGRAAESGAANADGKPGSAKRRRCDLAAAAQQERQQEGVRQGAEQQNEEQQPRAGGGKGSGKQQQQRRGSPEQEAGQRSIACFFRPK